MTKKEQLNESILLEILGINYIRISGIKQEPGFSPEAQEDLLKAYAHKHKIKIVRVFKETATARKTGRKAFNDMIDYLIREINKNTNSNKRWVILTEKTDRLVRNFSDAETLRNLGVTIHYVKENSIVGEKSSAAAKYVQNIKISTAVYAVDNLAEEASKGMRKKAEYGLYPSYAPLGYINIEQPSKIKIIVPDQKRAPIIKKLFVWFATGDYSLESLRQKAYEEEVYLSLKPKKLPKSTLHKILTNPIYYGDFKWAGELYRGTHEPIIEKEIFDQVQSVLSSRNSGKPRFKGQSWAYQGLLFCGHCGCAVTGEQKKKKYTYYRCTRNNGYCTERYTREEKIEQLVVAALGSLRLRDELLDYLVQALENAHSQKREHNLGQIASLTKSISDYKELLDNMYIEKLQTKISEEDYQRRMEHWSGETIRIRLKISEIEQANELFYYNKNQLQGLLQKLPDLFSRQPPEQKRRLLQCLFKKSKWADGRLTPAYREPFDNILVVTTNNNR